MDGFKILNLLEVEIWCVERDIISIIPPDTFLPGKSIKLGCLFEMTPESMNPSMTCSMIEEGKNDFCLK